MTMRRFHDHVMAEGIEAPPFSAGEAETLDYLLRFVPGAEVFDVTNVAEYIQTHYPNSPVTLNEVAKQSICVSPPYEVFWVEYNTREAGWYHRPANQFHLADALTKTHATTQPATNIGWLFSHLDEAGVQAAAETFKMELSIDIEGFRWLYVVTLFVRAREKNYGPTWSFLLPVYEDGSPDFRFFMQAVPVVSFAVQAFNALPTERQHYARACMWENLFPALYALSLLNCKNVEQVTHDGYRPRRHETRRGEKPGKQFKTLTVHPVRKVYPDRETPDEAYTKGLKSFHQVRGHWKDCRHGAGLFGNPNLKGLYYVQPHTRGQAAWGEIEKDYDVKSQ